MTEARIASRRPSAGHRARVVSMLLMASVAWSPSLAQAPQAPAADGGVQDIVVTAQKRAENSQNVPIAITAVSGAAIANRSPTFATTDLQQYVPGLVQGRNGTAGATFLRGVGADTGVAGSETPVATYLDGVYLGVNALGMFELNNIEQVSVLRGPQGTLFGRNATGGLIQIATRDPSHDFAGSADFGYGNYDTKTWHLYATGGFTSNLAGNVAVMVKDRDKGTIYNEFTGNRLQAETTYTIQSKLKWQVGDSTDVRLNFIRAQGDDIPGAVYFVQRGALSSDGQTRYVSPYTVNLAHDDYNNNRMTIGAVTINHDLGWARLSNIVSTTRYKDRSFDDQAMTTGLPNPNNVPAEVAFLNADIKEYTEEFQIQSPADQDFQWIAGFFYFWDHTKTFLDDFVDDDLAGPSPHYVLNSLIRTQSYAGYVQATKTILPDTKLTLGFRYTSDHRRFSGQSEYGPYVTPVPASLPDKVTDSKPTWRISLDHRFSRELLVYASYNRGFRSGNFGPISITNPAVKPEVLDAYEVGLKSDLLRRKVRFNLSGFYYDYRDLQLRTYQGIPPQSVFYNAANSEIYGLDADVTVAASRNLTLTGGVELLHAKYKDFPGGLANFQRPLLAVPANCTGSPSPGVGGTATLSCDLSGNRVIDAPKFSGSIAAEYRIPTSAGEFTINVADKYMSSYYASPDNFQKIPSRHWLTASINWNAPSGRFYGKIWGTNLTNAYNPAVYTSGGNTYEYVPGEPRLYGGTIGVRF